MYIVHFIGVDVDIPLKERTFDTKEKAKIFKHEHPKGKFAYVTPLYGTFGE